MILSIILDNVIHVPKRRYSSVNQIELYVFFKEVSIFPLPFVRNRPTELFEAGLALRAGYVWLDQYWDRGGI